MINSNHFKNPSAKRTFEDSKDIVEKKLKIPPDYQFKAINSKNFLQANWHKNKLLMLTQLVRLNKKMFVLDLGTGSGNFEMAFSKKVKKIFGVDYNDQALIFLQNYILENNLGNITLIQSDIRRLYKIKNLPKFDLIVLIDVIEHLKIKDVRKLVRDMKNLLRINGKVLIITPNYGGLWIIIEYLLDLTGLVPKFRGKQHLTQINKSKLLSVFKTYGFSPRKFFTFNLFSFIFPVRKLSRFFCIVESKIPFPIGNLIAATFTKTIRGKVRL